MGVSGVGGGGGGGLAVGQIRLSRGTGVPVMYNASADSAAARGTALASAWAAFAAGETLEVGPGTYTVSSGFSILGNQTIIFNGSQITLSVAGTLFTADSVSGWSMRGNAKLIGTGAGTETGLVVTGTGREWMIDGLHFSTWNTYGLHLSATGTSGGLYRGGKMSNLYFTTCATGLRVAVAMRPERALGAQLLGPAPSVDPAVQGIGWLLLIEPDPPPTGTALTATLHFAERAFEGVVVPRSAVLRRDGGAFVYVEASPGSFERRAASLLRPREDGWLATGALAPGEPVVVRGAQQLLGVEFSQSAPAETD
jgi:hypothetical protein